MNKAENLRNFFADPKNQTTRERIFYSRLAFDLKIAAARAGYHLHLYEPDVDRDGFDIVAEDEDYTGWYQTKAVLSSADTSAWEIVAGLLWPDMHTANSYGFAPAEAGRGGGVILIEIADETQDGAVIYSYTDFDIITCIAEGFLIERPWKGPGKPAKPAREEAANAIVAIKKADREKKVSIPKKLFIRVNHADDLLAIMRLRSDSDFSISSARAAYGQVQVDPNGSSIAGAPVSETSTLHFHMSVLCKLQPDKSFSKTTLFDPFKWNK